MIRLISACSVGLPVLPYLFSQDPIRRSHMLLTQTSHRVKAWSALNLQPPSAVCPERHPKLYPQRDTKQDRVLARTHYTASECCFYACLLTCLLTPDKHEEISLYPLHCIITNSQNYIRLTVYFYLEW